MKKEIVTEEWLYKYVPVLDDILLKDIETKVKKNYIFSKAFEKKMKKLIKKEISRKDSGIRSLAKACAIFFVGIIIAGLICTFSVEAYRNKFFDVIKEWLGDSVQYMYHTEDKYGIIENFELSYIPEGYSEIERIESDISYAMIYENENGYQITWEQKIVLDGATIVLDSEYDSCTEMNINGIDVEVFYYVDGMKVLYFEYGKYAFFVSADAVELEELGKMIKSIN